MEYKRRLGLRGVGGDRDDGDDEGRQRDGSTDAAGEASAATSPPRRRR